MGIAKTLSVIVSSSSKAHNPDVEIGSLLDIDSTFIKKYNVKYVIMDIDQTVAAHGTKHISADIEEHVLWLANKLGPERVCFLTNAPDPDRESQIADVLGVQVVSGDFRKPNREAYDAALKYLNAPADKSVAMVGDRLWTDIIGANRVGLLSVLVNPLALHSESVGIGLARKMETEYRESRRKFFTYFLTLLTLLGVGIPQIFSFIVSYVDGISLIDTKFSLTFIAFHLLFVFANMYFYYCVVSRARQYVDVRRSTNALDLFNTYPLFARFLISAAVMGVGCIRQFHPTLLHSLPENTLSIGLVMSFVFQVSLIVSLTRRYHTDIGRNFRVIMDIFAMSFIAYNVPIEFRYLFTIGLVLPVGTVARYFKVVPASIFTIICCLINGVLIYPQLSIVFSYSIFFVVVLFVIKLDYKDHMFPFDKIIVWMMSGERNSIGSFLEKSANILNCQAVYYVKKDNTGHYFTNYGSKEGGVISQRNGDEINNYLAASNCVITEVDVIDDSHLKCYNDELSTHLESMIRPHSPKGIVSAVAIELPNKSGCMLFMNNMTKNGILRSRFSVRHLRSLLLLTSIFAKDFR